MTITSVFSGLFATFLIFSHSAAVYKIDYARRRCTCPIPGTKLYVDVYYEIRISATEYAHGPLMYSSWTQKELNYYHVEAINPAKNNTFAKGDPLPPSMHWRFVETEIPGWYHLQNKHHPDKFITWSLEPQDKQYSNSWRLVLDSNYPGKHKNRMDFFVRPYRPKGVDIYVHQLKFKSRPTAVVSVSNYATSYDQVPVQVDLGEDVLSLYEPGHGLFDGTLFKFQKVNDTKSATSSAGWIYPFSEKSVGTFSWSLLLLMSSIAGRLGRIINIFAEYMQ